MEAQLQPPLQRTSAVITRLQTLANEIDALVELFKGGRLQPSSDEFKLFNDVSLKIGGSAPKIHREVQFLQKRRTEAVYAQGQKLLSTLSATQDYLRTGTKLKGRLSFVKTIQLLFSGPAVSKFDSVAVQARKRLNSDRCGRIRRLGPSGVVCWAATFAPSQWDANTMPNPVFDFVIEFLKLDERQVWTEEIIDILGKLRDEVPLKDSNEYERFLDDMSKTLRSFSSARQSTSEHQMTRGQASARA